MKKFVILLTVIFVTAGSAQARISSSRTFAHFPTCTDGLSNKCAYAAASQIPSGLLISFAGPDGIATPSMACADSSGDQRRSYSRRIRPGASR
jgi:hypothetical protein